MVKYIATKPVRLDRDYFIGDEIPADAISPAMIKRFMDWGKIQRITVKDSPQEETASHVNYDANDGITVGVEQMEKLLGINHGDALPDMETRIALCKEVLEAATADNAKTPPVNAQEKYLQNVQGDSTIYVMPGVENERSGEADGTGEAPEAETEMVPTKETKGEEPSEFRCDVCGKKCASKSGLASHMKTHEKE